MEFIEVRGAAEHNLKSIDVKIPRNKITVVTGVSGSGKSSLAFDTILAESNRRFFYTLSHYSRQFLEIGSRPNVKSVTGLSPAIALGQNETTASTKATIATTSDLGELLGIAFSQFGTRFCPKHGVETESLSLDQLTQTIRGQFNGRNVAIVSVVAREKKGTFVKPLESLVAKGFLRGWVNGELEFLSPLPILAKNSKHTIKVIIDIVKVKDGCEPRLRRGMEAARDTGYECEYFAIDGSRSPDESTITNFGAASGCPVCGFSWPRLDSRFFSSNSLGACETCDGTGYQTTEDTDNELQERNLEICSCCHGSGLDSDLDGIRLPGSSHTIGDLYRMTIAELRETTKSWEVSDHLKTGFERVRKEIDNQLDRLIEVGLDYVSLFRRIRSLSGGEAQRLRLAGILTERLRNMIYVLDEPSQGLHQSELESLWKIFEDLKDKGNTLIIVDHDQSVVKKADWIVDLGPGGGQRGGNIMACFRPDEASRFTSQSETARYLELKEVASGFEKKVRPTSFIQLNEVKKNNLGLDSVRIGLNAINVIAGVSGAGKSSLIYGVLIPNMQKFLQSRRKPKPIHCNSIENQDEIQALNFVTRRPIAKSSVSMPVTYLDVFKDLRTLYGKLPESQVAGLTNRSFSLSVEGGGRCEECKGRGVIRLQMRFLDDAKVTCPVCKGDRYGPNILEIRYLGLNLAEVLELTLDEFAETFATHKRILAKVRPALELGLGYLKVGQPTASLSGGEAQRLKLAPLLGKSDNDGRLIVLEEPTTGLHVKDADKLWESLEDLRNQGATIVMIEHNEHFIDRCDWLVELGPGSGPNGGKLMHAGPPSKR